MRNVIEQAQAAVDGGADALFVHGRTRSARYRFAADWDAIGSVVAAVSVPVVGNGDILFPHDVEQRAGAVGRGRRDERARCPDQAVAVPRNERGLSRPDARTSASRSIAATSRWRASIGAPMHTVSSACVNSPAGTSTSGIATRPGTRTDRSRACRFAKATDQLRDAARCVPGAHRRSRARIPCGLPGLRTRDRCQRGAATGLGAGAEFVEAEG